MIKECPNRPGYLVSDDGRVFSEYRSGNAPYRELKQETIRWGYKRVLVGGQKVLVHVLVLEAFVGPKPPGHEARHLDGSRDNNKVDNLAWGTARDNQLDKLKLDGNKLKENEVVQIKDLLKTCALQREIAEMFGVSRQTINDIANERTWSHV